MQTLNFSFNNEAPAKANKKTKKPKRNISAFHIFSKEIHAVMNHSGEKINPNKRMSLISEKWANLPQVEKEVYIEKAKLDKWRYLNELNEFYSSEASAAQLPSKCKPKKFGNAFTFYLREKKAQLRETAPQLSMSEIMSIAANEWKTLDKTSKKKYLDASEEDKKRYKEEVGEMTLKAKPAKNQCKKKLLKNAKNLEKTFDDLLHNSANASALLVNKRQVIEDEESHKKTGKIVKFPYELALKLSVTDSHKDSMIDESLPKLENKMNSIFLSEDMQASPQEMSLETDMFPKIEHLEDCSKQQPLIQEQSNLKNQPSVPIRSNSLDLFEFLNFGAKNSRILPKTSEALPKLPSLSSQFQLSFLEKKISNNEGGISKLDQSLEANQKQVNKGRNFLNGVLENTLDADFSISVLADLMKFSHSFMNEKSVSRDFFTSQVSSK